jgi:16S rRNA (uracil1498-N3)-methyltransferase
VGIFLHQDPLAQGTFHGYLGVGPDALALAVGPEGGFSPLEVEQLVSTRFLPALLGANVLRTETAAIFALAAVHAILLEKASWIPKTPDSPA